MDIDQIPYHEAKLVDQNGVSRIIRVPVVQELARQGVDFLPERFIGVPPGDLIAPSSVHNCAEISDPIPVIDMIKIQPGSGLEDREGELGKLARAAKEWGMFLVKNHGIEPKVLSDVRTVVKGFFGLSFEEKKASVGSYASIDNMGYGRNFVKSENQSLDWIDRLAMKAAPKDATQGLHVWPQKPPNFRPAIEKYVEGAKKLCDDLLQALGESLSADRNVFLKHFDEKKSEINVRVNYYPPCPRPDLAMGIRQHTDGSALTILIEFENSGGLQVYKDKKWVTVQWPFDELLVNLGDLMEIMSNGCFKSSWHRAVTQKDIERFSVALFCNPPMETEIEPLKSSNLNGSYKKVVVGEYMKHFYKINPSATKEAIKFAQF